MPRAVKDWRGLGALSQSAFHFQLYHSATAGKFMVQLTDPYAPGTLKAVFAAQEAGKKDSGDPRENANLSIVGMGQQDLIALGYHVEKLCVRLREKHPEARLDVG